MTKKKKGKKKKNPHMNKNGGQGQRGANSEERAPSRSAKDNRVIPIKKKIEPKSTDSDGQKHNDQARNLWQCARNLWQCGKDLALRYKGLITGSGFVLLLSVLSTYYGREQVQIGMRQEERDIARNGGQMVFHGVHKAISEQGMAVSLVFRNSGPGVAQNTVFEPDGPRLVSMEPSLRDVILPDNRHGGAKNVGPGDEFIVGIPSIEIPPQYIQGVITGRYKLRFTGMLKYVAYTDRNGVAQNRAVPLCQELIYRQMTWVGCLPTPTAGTIG